MHFPTAQYGPPLVCSTKFTNTSQYTPQFLQKVPYFEYTTLFHPLINCTLSVHKIFQLECAGNTFAVRPAYWQGPLVCLPLPAQSSNQQNTLCKKDLQAGTGRAP